MLDSDSPPGPTSEIELIPKVEEIVARLEALDPQQIPGTLRRLGLLYELGCTICDSRDAQRVTGAVLNALERLIPLDRCFVALLEDGRLKPLATHQIDLADDPDNWPVSKTMLRRVLNDNVSLLTSNAKQEPGYANVPSVGQHGLTSVMAVPLGPTEDNIGLIYADNRDAASYTDLDLLFLSALSHFVYLGIRNARDNSRATRKLQSAEARCNELQAELLRRHQIVGNSQPLLKTYQQLKLLADTDLSVLLSGETGTGKELLALTLHAESKRRKQPFVPVNLAAVAESLVDSELFGHEKGSYTGAAERRIGKLELANGGTLFLDEVADIPEHIQPKLLRAIEQSQFTRVGGNEPVTTCFRLVCATCKDLRKMVREGKFRQDLFFRVAGDEIKVPALRDRREDIPLLVNHVLKDVHSAKQFSDAALRRLQAYTWPGNVRQLRSVIQSLNATCLQDEITQQHVIDKLAGIGATVDDESDSGGFAPLGAELERVERMHIQKALEFAGGNRTEAARTLKISRQTLLNKIRQYGLEQD